MYISYSSSDSYAPYAGISIFSLLQNNQKMNIEEIFLLDNGISQSNVNKISGICREFGRKLTVLKIDEILERYSRKTGIPAFRGNYSTYARLIPEMIYPAYVDNLLIIDSDTVIDGELGELPDLTTLGKAVAAMDNPEIHLHSAYLSKSEQKQLHEKGFYMNCGVMIVNIPEWIQKGIPQRLLEIIPQIHEYPFADQTILNHVITEEDYVNLDMKYNSFFHCYPKYMVKYFMEKYETMGYKMSEMEEAYKKPIIIHYKGLQVRPWNKYCYSTKGLVYEKYKSQSPWRDLKKNCNITSAKEKILFWCKKVFRATPLTILRKKKYFE